MRRFTSTLKRWLRRAGYASPRRASPEDVRGLMRRLEQTREVEYTCDEVLELLDRFAEMALRGEDVARLLPLVQHHLNACADCREEYEALLRVLRASPA